MNLVKIADMLKNATDQSLASELQNPTGSVPSYMVLSELERRKKLRGSVMNPAPQTSVVEDKEAEFGGIAGLDQVQPDEYGVAQSEGYAGGGVVGYEGGGKVRRGWFGEEIPVEEDLPYAESKNAYGLADLATDLKTPYGYKKMFNVKPDFTPDQATARRQLIASGLSPENASRMVRNEAPITNTTPAGKQVYAPSANELPPPSAPLSSPSSAPASGGRPGRGGSIPGAAPASSTTDTTALSPEMKDLAAAREAGISGLSQYNDYLKQAIEENKASKAENAWQAVTMAGLGMLGGKSQNWQENVGAGALMGMQNFMGAERDRQKEGRALAMDMAQSGLKKSDILSNLAKAGFEGKKAEAYVNEALGKGEYYRSSAGAQRAAASAGIAGLKAENAKVSAINTEIKELQNQLKSDWTLPKSERAAISARITALQNERAKTKGYEGMGAGTPAPTGGTLAPGQGGRFVYTPGG